MEKPEINITEFVITGFNECDSTAISSSKDIPVINDRYDGKSGNTHGDKKETAPAKNATRRLIGSCIEHSFSDSVNFVPEAKCSYVYAAGPRVSLA